MTIEISEIIYNSAMFFVMLIGAFVITKFLSKLAGDDPEEK